MNCKESVTYLYYTEEPSDSSSSSDQGEGTKQSKEPIDPPDGMPVFTRTLSDLVILEGETVVLECLVSARHQPMVIWYKNSQILRVGVEYKQTYDGRLATLKVHEVFSSDAGTYECVARNAYGKVTSTCKLTVRG